MAIEVVNTKFGKLSGVREEGVLVFKGIPYAAPPVGELRWKPPADPEPWDGVRVCDAYGPRAVQPDFPLIIQPWGPDFYYQGFPEYSEDCLYLNVATDAASAEEKRPVYMWFHGGGLSTGHSYEIEFNPTVLAKKGVIVVSVGQRLNVFGYLSLPQLSAEQGGISGNYGLMDEVKALDWVRENIAAFGGDPDNITIGGQSGGTAKTGALARCPKAAGKIRRVINESSLNWNGAYPSMSEAEQEGVEFIVSLGFRPDASLEELRAADPEKFNVPGRRPFEKTGVPKPGAMVYDGVWVPEQDMLVSFDKYAGDLDYLTGGNLGESNIAMGHVLGGPRIATAEEFYAQAENIMGKEMFEKYDFRNTFAVEDGEAHATAKRLAAEGLTGLGGEMKNRCFGAYRKKMFPESKTYSYIFSRIPPGQLWDKDTERDPDVLMAWHSAELWYAFASLRVGKNGASNVPAARPWTDTDVQLADIMSSYWANFMKTGDPNGEGLPYWPASDETYGWVELGDEIVAHQGMDGEKDKMLEEFFYSTNDVPRP